MQAKFEYFPRLTHYGEKYFRSFKEEYETAKIVNGELKLYVCISPAIRKIYERSSGVVLRSPVGMTPSELKASEDAFIEAVSALFGNLSALDTMYALERLQLKRINESSVAGYVRRFHEIVERMDETEVLTDETLAKRFLKGIKNERFHLRMMTALEGETPSMSLVTKTIFEQQRLVQEALDDA
ncbi:hypothetical protein ADUPG1_000248, partial [Aduncisulcus paluster]